MFGKIDKQKLSEISHSLDYVGAANRTFVYIIFIGYIIVTMHFVSIFYKLIEVESITDLSIILVPTLGLITIFLLFPFQNYSNNIHSISSIAGVVGSTYCIVLLFSVIPIIGLEFDIVGISLEYWKLTRNIITGIYCYLFAFSITNFIITTTLERKIINGWIHD